MYKVRNVKMMLKDSEGDDINQRGVSRVKAYGDVPPKWVTFSPKILRHGFHFGKKISLEEGPISQKL